MFVYLVANIVFKQELQDNFLFRKKNWKNHSAQGANVFTDDYWCQYFKVLTIITKL